LTEELYFILIHSLRHSHPREILLAGSKDKPSRARRLQWGVALHSYTCTEVIM